MAKRKKKKRKTPDDYEVICQFCGSQAQFHRTSNIIYGRDYGPVWLCNNYPTCDAYVGAHGRNTPKPKATLADSEMRAWRKKAHAVFDPLFQTGEMSRKQAYKVMQAVINMSRDEAHIAKFNVEQCRILIDRINTRPEDFG